MKTPSFDSVDTLADAFEREWSAGRRPFLDSYLARASASAQAEALRELTRLDLEMRLRAGEDVQVEEYLTTFPQLSSERETVLDFIALECRVRIARGDPLSLDRILDRFPQHRAELARRLAFVNQPQLSLPPSTMGDYTILSMLGEGCMGRVFLAEDPKLARKIALKALHPELASDPTLRKRFLREARAAAALSHDHIPPIYEVGEDGGIPFFAMPLLKGETLQARLNDAGSLPVAQAMRITREIAEGLAAAHQAGRIHRDIKPANVWLESPAGRVKILDFGLARADGHADAESLTASGILLGTPAYMSPEQTRGEELDARSDLFSLGVVLYQMLTGQLPFQAASPVAMAVAIAEDSPPPPRTIRVDLPADLEELALALLAKSPQDRPASASEVAQRLRELEPETAISKALSRPRNPTDIRNADESAAEIAKPQDLSQSQQSLDTRNERRRLAWLLPLGALAASFLAWIWLSQPSATVSQAIAIPASLIACASNPLIEQELPNYEADRKAAHYLLSVGGQMKLALIGKDGEPLNVPLKGVARPNELPAPDQPFRITEVRIQRPDAVDDAGLAVFASCKHVTSLFLNSASRVTDAGVAHFKGCTDMMHLLIPSAKVNGEGLDFLKNCPHLEHVNLQGTFATDVVLSYLQNAKQLAKLNLSKTKVTDAGLAFLKNCSRLLFIDLSDTAIEGLELRHLNGCRDLTAFYLRNTAVTDTAMAQLTGPFPALVAIDLAGTKVSDAAMDQVAQLKGIVRVCLDKTFVGEQGLRKLTACKKIAWLTLDGLAIGDSAMPLLKELSKLRHLSLSGTEISDAGLGSLASLKELEYLGLSATAVTDGAKAALSKSLPKCKVP